MQYLLFRSVLFTLNNSAQKFWERTPTILVVAIIFCNIYQCDDSRWDISFTGYHISGLDPQCLNPFRFGSDWWVVTYFSYKFFIKLVRLDKSILQKSNWSCKCILVNGVTTNYRRFSHRTLPADPPTSDPPPPPTYFQFCGPHFLHSHDSGKISPPPLHYKKSGSVPVNWSID